MNTMMLMKIARIVHFSPSQKIETTIAMVISTALKVTSFDI
jgi:hypothetical protein